MREIDMDLVNNDETVSCYHCEREIGMYDKGVIEVQRVVNHTVYFCDLACRAKTVYEETYTAKGKASLRRFIAALHLLMDEDVQEWAPALTIYDADRGIDNLDPPTITQFREDAMKLLETLSPDDSVTWAVEAQNNASDFAEVIGSEVANAK